jgi:DNA-binding MarR family transcriptional regulator
MKENKNLFKGATQNQAIDIVNSITDKLNLAEGTGISINLSRKRIPIPNFTMVSQATALYCAKELSGSGLKVLNYFFGIMQYSNHIAVNQNTIAEETSQSLITVKKAIKELKDSNIIIEYKDQQDHRRNVYIVHPETAWRGSAAGRVKALRKIEAENKNQIKLFNSKENS